MWKKFAAIAMMIVMVFSLAACSGGSDTKDGSGSGDESTEAAAETEGTESEEGAESETASESEKDADSDPASKTVFTRQLPMKRELILRVFSTFLKMMTRSGRIIRARMPGPLR